MNENLIYTFLGVFLGSVTSFIISAYFADKFYIPIFFNRSKIFPAGSYYIVAPSREGEQIVTWSTEITERKFFASKISMITIWEDALTAQTGERKIWHYIGQIYKNGEYIVAILDLKQYKTGKVTIDGETFRADYRDKDPSFFVLHRRTETWTIQPGIMCGFSAVSACCYGAINILIPKNVKLTEEQKSSLFSESSFIDHLEAIEKVGIFCKAHGFQGFKKK